MASMKLTCGRFLPPAHGETTAELSERVARLEWYLGRLSEELELMPGAVGAMASAEPQAAVTPMEVGGDSGTDGGTEGGAEEVSG